jgi:hypothetical protein
VDGKETKFAFLRNVRELKPVGKWKNANDTEANQKISDQDCPCAFR